ncbi:phenylacetate--CoA ligase family protein [Clostridium sp. CF012]|uniref:phenylacetate--CoA ligase family protein n=1 Tax=Clostridium sp. CF012 TaxID=2843319 RepID=UPI001C0C47DC|nr:phenylacetate--CoA ligase family protein [Clostridium sp. CF012]MBU3142594.1 phenylacetate--CoA ligase family protein [Clostridium sp. CF012]
MLKQIIRKAPSFIEKPARYVYMSIPDYKRYGKTYREKYDFLKKSGSWTKDQQEEYQMEQINKLLEHAYTNVPYYTRVFDERGIKPKDIQNFNDLKQLPYLTKEIIQNNLEDLISKNKKKNKFRYVETSGTTAMPMGFYIDPQLDKAREWAYISNLWRQVGYDVNKVNKCVIIRGNIPKNGICEFKGRDLILSSFQLKEENMKEYIKQMVAFNPDFIQAYPSSIHTLSKYILRNNINIILDKLKCILCSSENLSDNQRLEIQKAFGVRIYNFYGHTEHACLAGECEQTSYFHLQSEYGYTEIIDENGQEVSKEDEVGEIVATGFNNYAVPFIRYKTGDLAANTNKECECGRNYKKIKRIEGRKQDFLVDRDGRPIDALWSDYPLWHIKEKVSTFQYIQNEPGKVILNIQCSEKLVDEDIKCVMDVFNLYYSGFEVRINIVDYIERTKRGKFRFLVQNLDITKLEGE